MRKFIRGFTLIEVMILLLIVALLLAMAVPALQKIHQAKQEHEKAAAEHGARP